MNYLLGEFGPSQRVNLGWKYTVKGKFKWEVPKMILRTQILFFNNILGEYFPN